MNEHDICCCFLKVLSVSLNVIYVTGLIEKAKLEAI